MSSGLSPGGYVRQGQRGVSPPRSVNVQVAVRCRPLNERERASGERSVVQCLSDRREVICAPPVTQRKGGPSGQNQKKTFTYDHVFGQDATQADVYEGVVEPIVDEVLQGYNCTVFAYGQTGTGKTHTMEGRRDAEMVGVEERRLAENAGIIPRAVKQVFDHLRSITDEHSVRVSHLELYNEQLTDLLGPGDVMSESLRMYEDPHKGTFVQGLEDIVVRSEEEIFAVLDKSAVKRRTAETLMNKYSSRSHSVFSITIHIKESTPEGADLLKVGKLNLVDLAGSENVGRSGAVKGRAREAGNINQSLLTLGRVITALVDRHPHIPYRDSKLTRLLQESLGGRNKTCVIATVTPGSNSLEETASTLDYAYRAKSIKNRPTVNQMIAKHVLLKEYTEEIQKLKKELDANRSKNGVYLPPEEFERLQMIGSQQKETISDLENRNEEFEKKSQALKEKLERTQDALAREQKELAMTKETLSDVRHELGNTRENLDIVRQQNEEKAYLLRHHVATESTLRKQGTDLQSTVSSCKSDLRALHSRVDSKLQLEKENVQNLFVLKDTVSQGVAAFRESLEKYETEQCAQMERSNASLSTMLRNVDESLASIVLKMKALSRRFDDLEVEHMKANEDIVTQFQESTKERITAMRQKMEEHGSSDLATKRDVMDHGASISESLGSTQKAIGDIKNALSAYHSSHALRLKEFVDGISSTFSGLNSEVLRHATKQDALLSNMQNANYEHYESQKKWVEETKESLLLQVTNSLENFMKESHARYQSAQKSFAKQMNAVSSESTEIKNAVATTTGLAETRCRNLAQKDESEEANLQVRVEEGFSNVIKLCSDANGQIAKIGSTLTEASQLSSDWLADANEDLTSSQLANIRLQEELDGLRTAQFESRRALLDSKKEEFEIFSQTVKESASSAVNEASGQLNVCRQDISEFVADAKDHKISNLHAPIQSFAISCDLEHSETPPVREWPSEERLAQTRDHASLVNELRSAKGYGPVPVEAFSPKESAGSPVDDSEPPSNSSPCSQENEAPIDTPHLLSGDETQSEDASADCASEEKGDDTGTSSLSSTSEIGEVSEGMMLSDTTNRRPRIRTRRVDVSASKKPSGIPLPKGRSRHRVAM